MIPELGTFSLIIALCFALIQCATLFFQNKILITSRILSVAAINQFVFLLFAMLCLIVSFLNNDLSVIYVQEHSHPLLPLIYRIGAAWGGHEGSLLLWCLILSAWTTAFVFFHDPKISNHFFSKNLSVLGLISTGFILFLLTTSNPFARDFPQTLINGNDLTPVLQDPGLVFHPPMLYLGYVGFAIGFAFAMSALIEGKLEKEWVFSIRPWIILPWAFLSVGIVLGSWWAYRELGWGGYWFWDPVENASLLPWLSATALIHSLIVSEKRKIFQGWSILLAIMTFALSLIGTFLVRSGVLVSVHTFASDPSRGLFLLGYLGLLIGGALILYGARIKLFYRAPEFNLFSRETFLLLNNVFLLTAVATILLGTLYPIILDALNLEKISVGEPYFNSVFLPIILPMLFLMAVAPHVNWSHDSINVCKRLQWDFILSLVLSLIILKICHFPWQAGAMIGLFLAFFIVSSTVSYLFRLKKNLELKHLSMVVAHVGIAVIVIGITMTKSYSEERQIKISPGETVTVAGYPFYFKNIETVTGQNFKSIQANFLVGDKLISAEQRIYQSHEQTLGKPGIIFNPFRDLYLALGAPVSEKEWSVRIYYKPYVRWIWLGGFLLFFAGLISLFNYAKVRLK